MSEQSSKSIPPDEAGCWLDCARGIYIGEEIQTTAASYGWTDEPASVDSDEYHDATQEAEDYMNTLAPEGYYFGSTENGDWGLWEITED